MKIPGGGFGQSQAVSVNRFQVLPRPHETAPAVPSIPVVRVPRMQREILQEEGGDFKMAFLFLCVHTSALKEACWI